MPQSSSHQCYRNCRYDYNYNWTEIHNWHYNCKSQLQLEFHITLRKLWLEPQVTKGPYRMCFMLFVIIIFLSQEKTNSTAIDVWIDRQTYRLTNSFRIFL